MMAPQKTLYKTDKNISPFGADIDAKYSIGEVASFLRKDFPNILNSKIRFFEMQKFVIPKRGQNGYRRYSNADLQKLKFILTLQRDRFYTLKHIEKTLRSIDKGLVTPQEIIANWNGNFDTINTINSNDINIDFIAFASKLDVETIENILIKINKNIYDVKNNPKAYITFFRLWNAFRSDGLTETHFDIVNNSIKRIFNTFSLLENSSSNKKETKKDFILFIDTLMNLGNNPN
jgi:DNA-binding transcriptional MerR regulator